MVLVFLLLGFLILINSIVLLILLSNIKLEVTKLHISNNETEKINILFKSKIRLYLFGKIPIFKITIDNNKIRNLYKSGKIDINKLKGNKQLNKEALKLLKNMKIRIEKFKLKGYIGTENAAFTAFLVTFLNIIISIIINQKINQYKKEKYKYAVDSVYINQNIVNLEINCIISVKMVHIINVIYILFKKGRVNKNERTSNRRSYAYSNE